MGLLTEATGSRVAAVAISPLATSTMLMSTGLGCGDEGGRRGHVCPVLRFWRLATPAAVAGITGTAREVEVSEVTLVVGVYLPLEELDERRELF